MPRTAVPYGWLHHCNLFHVIRKRLSVLFLLIGMFKGQHFSMDGIQKGFFFSQKWCTVELLHNGHLEDRSMQVAVLERFKQESMHGLATKKVPIV